MVTRRRWHVLFLQLFPKVQDLSEGHLQCLSYFFIYILLAWHVLRTMRTQMSLHSDNTNYSGIFAASVPACNCRLWLFMQPTVGTLHMTIVRHKNSETGVLLPYCSTIEVRRRKFLTHQFHSVFCIWTMFWQHFPFWSKRVML